MGLTAGPGAQPWGASSTMLAEIAQSTYDYQEYPVVMQGVWKRVNESGRNWRIVYKARSLGLGCG